MTTQNYLIIESNVVTNTVVWDGNTQTWTPPANATTLVQATTPAMVWVIDYTVQPNTSSLQEVVGAGQIGFTWNGSVLTTNQPEPTPPKAEENQPYSTGTTTI